MENIRPFMSKGRMVGPLVTTRGAGFWLGGCLCVCVCVCVYACIYIKICTQMCVCVCVNVCMGVRAYVFSGLAADLK
jgi:hypothetical protein